MAKVFCFAIILDIVYQLIVFRWVYPLEALIMAFVLALLPLFALAGSGEPNRTPVDVWRDEN